MTQPTRQFSIKTAVKIELSPYLKETMNKIARIVKNGRPGNAMVLRSIKKAGGAPTRSHPAARSGAYIHSGGQAKTNVENAMRQLKSMGAHGHGGMVKRR